jgi:predicted PurR-regulated permease PerM
MGLVGGVLDFIPYLGSIVFTAASAAMGLMQLASSARHCSMAGVSVALHTLSG